MLKKYYRFKNGATIIYKKRKVGKATAMYAGFFCGAMYEKNGMPHFFEHMLFKGTNKRSVDDIIKDKSKITYLNACTNHYYMAVNFYESNKRIDKCFEYSSDVLLGSKFEQAYIDKEADVILEEAASDVNDLRRNLFLNHTYFIKEQYKNTNDYVEYWFGSEKFLKGLKTKDFLDFRNKHFVTDKFFVSVATTLPFYKIKKLVKKYYLSKINEPKEKSNIIPFVYYPLTQKQGINFVKNDNSVIRCMVSIKMDTKGENYRYDYNFNCISRTISLRDDMFFYVCRKNGYVYDCDSYMYYNDNCDKIAYIFTFTTSKFENVEKIFSVIGETIKKLKNGELTENDVKDFKEGYYVSIDKPSFTSFQSHALNQITLYYKYGKEKQKSNSFTKKQIKKVTVNSVKENIDRCFNKENDIHITIMANIDEDKIKSVNEYKNLIFKD